MKNIKCKKKNQISKRIIAIDYLKPCIFIKIDVNIE